MLNRWLPAFFLTLVFAAFHYWLFEMVILSASFAILFFLLMFSGFIIWQKETFRQQRDETMYYFIQMFLTTLTIKKTVLESYLDVYQRYQLANHSWLQSYGSNDPLLVLENLQSRFPHPLFIVFVNTVKFYETQGGDVLDLFESVLTQTRLVETRRMEKQQLKKRYFWQWFMLWSLNLFVLFMAKIVLLDLFTTMMTSFIFVMMLTVVLWYVPISFLMWINTFIQGGEKTR